MSTEVDVFLVLWGTMSFKTSKYFSAYCKVFSFKLLVFEMEVGYIVCFTCEVTY